MSISFKDLPGKEFVPLGPRYQDHEIHYVVTDKEGKRLANFKIVSAGRSSASQLSLVHHFEAQMNPDGRKGTLLYSAGEGAGVCIEGLSEELDARVWPMLWYDAKSGFPEEIMNIIN